MFSLIALILLELTPIEGLSLAIRQDRIGDVDRIATVLARVQSDTPILVTRTEDTSALEDLMISKYCQYITVLRPQDVRGAFQLSMRSPSGVKYINRVNRFTRKLLKGDLVVLRDPLADLNRTSLRLNTQFRRDYTGGVLNIKPHIGRCGKK